MTAPPLQVNVVRLSTVQVVAETPHNLVDAWAERGIFAVTLPYTVLSACKDFIIGFQENGFQKLQMIMNRKLWWTLIQTLLSAKGFREGLHEEKDVTFVLFNLDERKKYPERKQEKEVHAEAGEEEEAGSKQ